MWRCRRHSVTVLIDSSQHAPSSSAIAFGRGLPPLVSQIGPFERLHASFCRAPSGWGAGATGLCMGRVLQLMRSPTRALCGRFVACLLSCRVAWAHRAGNPPGSNPAREQCVKLGQPAREQAPPGSKHIMFYLLKSNLLQPSFILTELGRCDQQHHKHLVQTR